MPSIQGEDFFRHGDFTVPGGGNYTLVAGPPALDATLVRPFDPASLLIATSAAPEYVRNSFSGSPSMGWTGFAIRINAADEPAGIVNVTYMSCVGGTSGLLSYSPSTNSLIHSLGASTDTVAIALDAWHWIEMIHHPNAATHTLYTRVDGVDMTPVTLVEAAAAAEHVYLGTAAADTLPGVRYSCHLWGTAASSTDWLGEQTYFGRHGVPPDYSRFPKEKLRRAA